MFKLNSIYVLMIIKEIYNYINYFDEKCTYAQIYKRIIHC